MNSSKFMDKQIMGLSGSPDGGGGGEFFDLMNPQEDLRGNGGVLKKEEIIPSYDFQPMRPAPSPPASFVDDAPRTSRFSLEPLFGESPPGPDIKLAHHYGASVDNVESTVKKYADILLHALEGMSSRLSQLETRACILENSVDDLKVSVGNNYGNTDGKLRQLESFMREVHANVQLLRDKKEIAEAHIELAKLQLSTKADHHQSESSRAKPESQAPQLSAVAPSLPPLPLLPAPNVPPPPPLPQQNQPPVLFASQLSLQPQMPSIPSLPQELSYSKPSPQSQHYQSSPRVPQYSQPIQPEESKYYMPPSHPYTSNIRQPSPPSQAPTGPPLHEYYGTNPPMYELPPRSMPSSGSMPSFSEPYLYGTSPSYNIKPSPFSSAPPTLVGSGSYQRLPMAKILPQAVPAESSTSGGGSTGNRVPVDDVVDKVATMGFSRDQVRATVRKLTENGQSVDLNVVLDKLMNDGRLGR